MYTVHKFFNVFVSYGWSLYIRGYPEELISGLMHKVFIGRLPAPDHQYPPTPRQRPLLGDKKEPLPLKSFLKSGDEKHFFHYMSQAWRNIVQLKYLECRELLRWWWVECKLIMLNEVNYDEGDHNHICDYLQEIMMMNISVSHYKMSSKNVSKMF